MKHPGRYRGQFHDSMGAASARHVGTVINCQAPYQTEMSLDTEHGRIRIAYVHYRDSAEAGGSLRVGETLAEHLAPDVFETCLVFAYGGPGAVSSSTAVPCHFLRSKGPLDLPAWARARAFFRRLSPQILHFQDPVLWLRAALVGTSGTKLLHVHGKYRDEELGRLPRLSLGFANRTAAARVCISRGARQSVLDRAWGRPETTWVVYNSVGVSRYGLLPNRFAARELLGIPQPVRVLGMVCRMTALKGGADGIRLLRFLDEDWHLLLCGEGPYRPQLEILCRDEAVEGRVHFVGSLDDVRWAYGCMDAFLFAAHYEPFGLVMAEAMAAGVPVFGLGGQGEYREPEYPLITEENAVFVERKAPRDHESDEPLETLATLALRIEERMGDLEALQKMVRNARDYVKAYFDASVQAENMAKHYLSLLSSESRVAL